MIFGDVLSGIDTITNGTVFLRVLGQTGLLRQTGTTAILAIYSGKIHYYPLS